MRPVNTSIYEAFDHQARQTPQSVCLTDGQIQLTYQQTKNAVECFAGALQQRGVITDSVVGLYADKKVDVVIAFLTVAALGARCVQIDKSFPDTFFKEVLSETNTDILLHDGCSQDLIGLNCTCVDISQLHQLTGESTYHVSLPQISADQIVWLVYSSGTTGRHKGIAISHRAILSSYQMRYQIKDYDLTSVVGCNIYYLWEVLRPILRGGTTFIINDDILYDFQRLVQTMVDHQLTEFLFTPSYLETLLYSDYQAAVRIFDQLDCCWLNGEVVTTSLYKQLMPFMAQTAIYNLYSISECHDIAVYQLKPEGPAFDTQAAMPVGYLLEGVETAILDKAGVPVPEGEKGELYVYSPGLAKGYINRIELNKERFVEINSNHRKLRMYKTGDYASRSNDNLLTIYGRCDYFVRLRGYNIALPFVESVIKDKLEVAHCVVCKEGESALDEHLVAYLEVPEHQQAAFYQQWRLDSVTQKDKALIDVLSSHLPAYMLPKRFELLNAIGINPYSNKIERKNLTKTYANNPELVDNIRSVGDYRRLWAALLKMDATHISDEDGFFELGGTSLSAMILLSRIARSTTDKPTISEFVNQDGFLASYQYYFSNQLVNPDTVLSDMIRTDLVGAFDRVKLHVKDKTVISRSMPDSKTWLLTGSTGFLGGHLLKQILTESNDKVYCLIRAGNSKQANQRLKQVADKLNIEPNKWQTRVKAVAGDLASEDLGLSWQMWHDLEQHVDGVINAAADVNLVLPYNRLKKVTVDGVEHLLKLCFYDYKPFYQVSTNGIFPVSDDIMLTECEQIDHYLPLLSSGYAQAKWASEALLYQAKSQGIPVTVFRPGNISHSHQDYINITDMNWLIIEAIESLQLIPKGLYLEMTSVNHISRFMVNCLNQNLYNTIFNMTNKHYITFYAMAEMTGYPVVTVEQWKSQVKDERLLCLIDHDDSWLDAREPYRQAHYEYRMKTFGMDYPDQSLDQWHESLSKMNTKTIGCANG